MLTRRNILGAAAKTAVTIPFLPLRTAQAAPKNNPKPSSVEGWMNGWMTGEKPLGSAIRISRFRNPVYFLIAPISWSPNLSDTSKYQEVQVPTGFVTDFASIPRVFFSILPPDGEYAYAAVIHDYLYWTQERSRQEADEIFKLAMRDLQVSNVKTMVIYKAVQRFGAKAWNDNAKLKSQGEKRVLVKFPEDPTINWDDWKKRPDVFPP